jgi:hypothetical protein
MRIPAVRLFCVIVVNLPPPVPRNIISNIEFMNNHSGNMIFALCRILICNLGEMLLTTLLKELSME